MYCVILVWFVWQTHFNRNKLHFSSVKERGGVYSLFWTEATFCESVDPGSGYRNCSSHPTNEEWDLLFNQCTNVWKKSKDKWHECI